MPGTTVIHAAFFAAGAAAGGGLTAALVRWRQKRDADTTTVARPSSLQVAVDARTPSAGAVLRYGNPGPISDALFRKGYVAAYDRRLRHPAWTAEHLTLASLGRSQIEGPSNGAANVEKGDRSKSEFAEDLSIPERFRARLQDFIRSGYDRGHMVPAADVKFAQEAMDESFLLTNIAPQVGVGFNRHYWAYLEDWCRRLTASFQDVYVFTVPLYLPRREADGKWRITYEMIGSPPNVSVPTHFAKVILVTRPSSPATPDVLELSTGAFVLPNAPIPDEAPLESFVVPVDAVERAAGLTLFSDEIKVSSKHICRVTECSVIVRRFDEVRKRPELRRSKSAP